jgi:hypothetical protein
MCNIFTFFDAFARLNVSAININSGMVPKV